MLSLVGITEFNGKHAEVIYAYGMGDPGQWFINLDGDELTIEDGQGGTQVDYIKPLLKNAEGGNVHAANFVRDIFAKNWQNIGLPEDVIALVLQHVEYSQKDKEADLVEIERLEAVISKSLDGLAAYAHNGGFKANGFADLVAIQAKEYKKIEDRISFITTRVESFDKLQAGELVGRNWNNATFYADAKSAEFKELVTKILIGKI